VLFNLQIPVLFYSLFQMVGGVRHSTVSLCLARCSSLYCTRLLYVARTFLFQLYGIFVGDLLFPDTSFQIVRRDFDGILVQLPANLDDKRKRVWPTAAVSQAIWRIKRSSARQKVSSSSSIISCSITHSSCVQDWVHGKNAIVTVLVTTSRTQSRASPVPS